MKVLIDTNILVYAYDSEAPAAKREKAEKIIRALWQKACVSAQNLSEAYAVLTEKKKTDAGPAKEIIKGLGEGFHVLGYGKNEVYAAMDLQSQHKLHYWDALLAATAKSNGVELILTENEKDFPDIPWLKVENPLI